MLELCPQCTSADNSYLLQYANEGMNIIIIVSLNQKCDEVFMLLVYCFVYWLLFHQYK